jgi:hypothetical protein
MSKDPSEHHDVRIRHQRGILGSALPLPEEQKTGSLTCCDGRFHTGMLETNSGRTTWMPSTN